MGEGARTRADHPHVAGVDVDRGVGRELHGADAIQAAQAQPDLLVGARRDGVVVREGELAERKVAADAGKVRVLAHVRAG